MADWITPRALAKRRGVRPGTVYGWIRSGELLAVNHAVNPHGPARWKISEDALAMFDAARSNRASALTSSDGVQPAADRRRRSGHRASVEEFFA